MSHFLRGNFLHKKFLHNFYYYVRQHGALQKKNFDHSIYLYCMFLSLKIATILFLKKLIL